MSTKTTTKTTPPAPAPAPAPAPDSGKQGGTATPGTSESSDDQTQVGAGEGKTTGPAYPRTVRVTNNTPIPLYLTEARAHLAANFHAPRNTATVVYQAPDAFAREQANVAAIARAHGFTDPLLVEDAE